MKYARKTLRNSSHDRGGGHGAEDYDNNGDDYDDRYDYRREPDGDGDDHDGDVDAGYRAMTDAERRRAERRSRRQRRQQLQQQVQQEFQQRQQRQSHHHRRASRSPPAASQSSSGGGHRRQNRKNRRNDDDDGIDGDTDVDDDEEDVYIVRQQHGICSILFSIVQTVILAVMMWQCGVAPLSLNPMLGPYPDALSEWGGKNAVLIIDDHETYRLVTPILLHAGVLHLLGNVLVQLETGVFFEREWGSVRWLIVYLASAVGSSVLSVIAMPNAVSVGSSGAVMGLFGAKLSEVVLRSCDRHVTKQDAVAAAVRQEQCCVVTVSVIAVMLFSFIPFVDWAAHVGGLVTGILVGVVVFACDIPSLPWRVIWLIIGVAAVATYFAYTITYMYSGQVAVIDELRDVCGYYEATYPDYQCNCMRAEYLNYNNNNNGGNNNDDGGG